MGYLSCNADSAIPICNSIKHSSSKVLNVQEITEFSYSDLLIATNDFSTDMFLGKGSHGRVYRALLQGRSRKFIAAVKKTKGHKLNSCAADNEIEILSKVRNPGLVNLIGYSVDDSAGEKLIVVEYMPNGTLYDLLHTTTNKKAVGWRKRVRMALEIAKAIDSLHSATPPVIHRDIKSSNVLLDGKMSARVGDFGLAFRGDVGDERVKCSPRPAGTLGYLDPSYLVPGDLSTKSDVFSFGILLLEIISGRNAIDVDYSPPSIIDWAIPLINKGDFAALCDRRIGPPPDASIIQQLGQLASRCVAVDAKRRPEIREVSNCLKQIRVGSSSWSYFTWSGSRCLRKQETGSRQLVVSDPDNNNQKETVVKDIINDVAVRRGRVSISMSNGTHPHQEGMSRSKSIGSVDEIRRPVGTKQEAAVVKMRIVRLTKSRSVGVLYSRTRPSLVRLGNEKEDEAGEERELLISISGSHSHSHFKCTDYAFYSGGR